MKRMNLQSPATLCWTTFLILGLTSLAVRADFNGSDNFSSGSGKWTAVGVTGTGSLSVNNGRYEYTATGAGTTEDHAGARWNINQGSFTNDWAVQVDVHLAAFTGSTNQELKLGLAIINGTTNLNQYVGIGLYRDHSFTGFEMNMSPNDARTEITTSTTDAALRISYDSAAKTLTAWYDADGAANGYTWIPIETISISTDTNNWGMTANSQFSAVLTAGSGVEDGTGPNIAVTGSQAYFDNFLATSFGSTNSVPPNGGSITSPPFSGTKGLYDLTGFITGFDLTMAMNTDYDIAEDIRVVQSITGAFTAGDTGTVMTVNANGSVDVPVTYTLKGSLSPKGTHLAGALSFSCKGTGIYGTDGPKQYGEKLTSTFTLDPVTGNLTGQTTGTTSKSGKGTAKLSPTPLPPITLTPLEWSLSMTVTAKVTKVTGTATVNLANGRNFPFTVKGTTKNGVSKLTLTGTVTNGTECTDSGKGATLTVTLTGQHITGITGSLLGQKINLSRL